MNKPNATSATYAHAKGARAAARKVLGAEAAEGQDFNVTNEGERFGWEPVKAKRTRTVTPASSKQIAAFPTVSAAKKLDIVPAKDDAAASDNAEQEETVVTAPSAAANAFGAFANAQLTAAASTASTNGKSTPKPVAERKPKVPAEIKNGVRRPTAGTVCRAVWDELDKMVTPDSKQVKALAEAMKWNPNNASIEFYQWRKFNGISGRVKVAASTEEKVS